MQAIEILDIKQFMRLLFQTDTLDHYEMVSAEIRTDISYSIDGKLNQSFYNKDELSLLQLEKNFFLPWQYAKEKIFSLIKGKKTPCLLKLILKVNPIQAEDILSLSNSSLNSNDIDGFFLNIIFQENKLNVICGLSYKIFTMDRELENYFSKNIITLFKSKNITCQY
ncbi:MAG: hypothetical protein K2I10_02495 [Lachnospiraceae bacterium]|nr:hypothetical protein [Lachnospiraceae bacterium]